MKNFFLLLVISLFLFGCEKDPIEQGVVSTVQGNIYDPFNRISFEDIKVKIAEFKTHRNGITSSYEFIQWIDSAYSDTNGDYFLSFKTSGKGDNYRLYIEEKPDLWTYYFDPIEIINIGGNNIHDLGFLQLYPVNLNITMNNLEYSPIRMSSIFSSLQNFETADGEIQKLIYTNKFTETQLQFSRKNLNGIYEYYSVIIPPTNSSGLSEYYITLSNGDFVAN